MANTPISVATIEQLALAIAHAVNQSGGNGGRAYNPINNQVAKQSNPEDRVAVIRTHKTSQNANQIATEMLAIAKKQIRSTDDLERMLDFNRKTLSQAINKYEDFGDAQRQMVKELKAQLRGANVPASVKTLAGSIDQLEDVLRFSDATKAAAELAKSLKDTIKTGNNVLDIERSIESLKKSLPAGKTLADVDQSLAALAQSMDAFNVRNRGVKDADGKVTYMNRAGTDAASPAEQIRLQRRLAKQVQKAGSAAQNAVKVSDNVATAGHTVAMNANITTIRRADNALSLATKRIDDWGIKVGSAAFALDQLAAVAVNLYKTIKEAAATGTQRSLFEGVLSREITAITTGVSVATVQQGQKAHAMQRNAAGRDAYDGDQRKQIWNFFKLTADLDEAAKQFAETADMIGKQGVTYAKAAKVTAGMTSTFNELTYLTGMTTGELNAMNAELVAGNEYRQTLAGLNEQERSQAMLGLDLMIKENAIRGISIQQSKEMLKATQSEANPFSPKGRMKTAAKLRLVGAATGMAVERAAKVIDAGGYAQRRAELAGQGMTPAQVQAEMDATHQEEKALGTRNSKSLGGRVTTDGLITEQIGIKSPELKAYYDGTRDVSAAKARALDEKATKDFAAGSAALLAGATLMAAGWTANAVSSNLGTIGLLIGGAIATYIGRRFLIDKVSSTLPVVNSLLQRFGILGAGVGGAAVTAGAAAGAGAAGAAGAATLGPAAAAAAAAAALAASRGGITGVPSIPTVSSPASKAMDAAKAAVAATKNSFSSVWNTIKGGAAALTPGAASVIPRIPTVSGGAGATGAAAKVGGVLKGGLGYGLLGLGADYAGDKLSEAGNNKTGAATKILGSAATYAGVGAMVGSFVPVIGNAVGAGVGGVIGAGMGLYNNFGGLTGAGPTPADPTQPSARAPDVNTLTDSSLANTAATSILANSIENPSSTKTRDVAADNTIILASAVSQMNSTLGSILELLRTTSSDMNGASEAGLAMQKRLNRALKGSGIAGDASPASQAYNS